LLLGSLDVIGCSTCGAENPSGQKFCGECGSPLVRACPSCGAANPPGQKFCGECGSQLEVEAAPATTAATAAPPAPPAPAPASERRLVSVLFADLVGFTTLSESRDSEEVREILSRYFDSCRRLISLYGGTVEKFIGDAVMAVWGTPTATEDDAERAVRAALDLVAAVSALGDELSTPDLRARAGVLTGEAAVTIGAEGEGMVAGDMVNTASRIQSLAPAGSVYVGDSTRRATEQTIVYEDAGSHELQGKSGLYPLWRALRIVSGARGSLKSHGLEAPFVGRDRELRLIKEFFHGSAEEGKAHLVSVMGIAGIGKSRLAWEFFKYMDGLPQLTYWHRGRCLSYGEGVTYWALADMVRMRCRITEDEQAASALAKVRATLAEQVPDEEERRFVEPRVAHLLGLEDGPRYERDDLFAAWRIFFERLADNSPVVMVFEDMQWADDSLLDFIDYLLEWSRNSALFVVTLARPELQDKRPTWGGRRNLTSLYLEPLSAASMERLLSGLVPGLPEDVRLQILERAEGIPLYAVETVRMLLDRGALVEDGPVYRPTGPIASLEVPETLHALIAARLDGLTQDERRLLQDASVLGKTFTKRALAALSSLGDVELDTLLGSLLRKEVLAIQADPRSPEHGQHSFLQDLVRHVAYETLSRRERRSRHLAAATHLEATFPEEDEIVEVVASHYLDAYRADPDAADAVEIQARAREMLARAGERAASLAAGREAQRYFEQAAELTDDPLVRADLHDRAARMAWRRGKGPEARTLFEQALSTFDSAGLNHPAARVSARLAEIDFLDGHTSHAVARLEKALQALTGDEPDADLAVVAAQLARFLTLSGQHEEALPHFELALELAEALALPEVFAEALTSKAVLLTWRNRLDEGRIVLEGSLAHALAHDLPATSLRAYNNLAVIFESRDRYTEALELSDRAVQLARRVGDRNWERQLLAGPISALVLLGRWDEAASRAAELEGLPDLTARALLIHLVAVDCWRGKRAEARARLESFASVRDSEDIQSWSAYALHEAMLLRAEGKPHAALETLEQVVSRQEELGFTFLTAKLSLVEALESAFELGDTGKLEQTLAIVDALRPGERPPLLTAHAARFRARSATTPAEADAGFAKAAELFRELGMIFWLAVTQLEHGEWLMQQDRGLEADPLLAEARDTFERLEARPWLDRLRASDSEQLAEAPV
jgi:class 3 adenylate cyclase/tetratricopeptide (TPR) repeat protein